ncbi:hypothetical protein A9488_07510 [Bacillus cereus]|nr:hypothetical protein A9488_07510 [Bacillus cereus]
MILTTIMTTTVPLAIIALLIVQVLKVHIVTPIITALLVTKMKIPLGMIVLLIILVIIVTQMKMIINKILTCMIVHNLFVIEMHTSMYSKYIKLQQSFWLGILCLTLNLRWFHTEKGAFGVFSLYGSVPSF